MSGSDNKNNVKSIIEKSGEGRSMRAAGAARNRLYARFLCSGTTGVAGVVEMLALHRKP